MTRGQRAAQPPKFGAWKLTGVVAFGKKLYVLYERTAMHMLPDGLWQPSTESKTLDLDHAMHEAKVSLQDYAAMRAAFGPLADRLRDLATQHQKPPENES